MKNLRTVICGSNYGVHYLRSVASKDSGFRLAGIMGKGSERSQKLAMLTKVPLYKTVAEFPKDIDCALVAIGPPQDVEITEQLLNRGIHVLAEHPVNAASLKRNFQNAKLNSVCYNLNCHWGDLTAIQYFISYCHKLSHLTPIYISIITDRRSCFSILDIIGRALQSTETYNFHSSITPINEDLSLPKLPLQLITGSISNIPIIFQIQSLIATKDDGSDIFISHQITIAYANGNLTLVGPWGPVIWTDTAVINQQTSVPVWHDISCQQTLTGKDLYFQRTSANLTALTRFANQLRDGITTFAQSEQHLLNVAIAWDKLCSLYGPRTILTIDRQQRFPSIPFNSVDTNK